MLRPLIEAGQLQLINHTFNHPNLITLPAPRIRENANANAAWNATIVDTSTRPYGRHNAAVDDVAAEIGLDQVVPWNGSFTDSQPLTPQFLIE